MLYILIPPKNITKGRNETNNYLQTMKENIINIHLGLQTSCTSHLKREELGWAVACFANELKVLSRIQALLPATAFGLVFIYRTIRVSFNTNCLVVARH